jgi:trans-2,3-dihydro-3-hydroxyanthranilate isomerase
MPAYRYFTADVFTSDRFGGNQLAVLPDARGLDTATMHAIAREFNYSETTFVLPPDEPSHARRVRIFAPGGEIPFAGHPTVGTAHVLFACGELAPPDDANGEARILLGENVGPVPVTVRFRDREPVFAELSVARLPERLPDPPSRAVLAEVLSLAPEDLLDGDWAPEALSCGLPFVYVPLRDRDAVRRTRLRLEAWERAFAGAAADMIMVFSRDPERPGSDVRARMFAPGANVAEDPATGSACAALAGYLAPRTPGRDGTLRWTVEQGFEMGRPSILYVEADTRDGTVTAVRVGGETVMVCEGTLRL